MYVNLLMLIYFAKPRAAKFAREALEKERRSHEKNNKFQVAPTPISSRSLCPLPLLLSVPNQNRHATQAISVGVACTSFSVFSSTSCLKQAWLLLKLSGLLDAEVRLGVKPVICIGHRLGGSECCPPLYIAVGPDELLEDTPVFWSEDGALNPLLLDVVNKIAEWLGLCLNVEGHEHRSDLVVRQELNGRAMSFRMNRCVASSLQYAVWRPSSCTYGRQIVKICDLKENVRLKNGLLKVMLHGMTVCPNAGWP